MSELFRKDGKWNRRGQKRICVFAVQWDPIMDTHTHTYVHAHTRTRWQERSIKAPFSMHGYLCQKACAGARRFKHPLPLNSDGKKGGETHAECAALASHIRTQTHKKQWKSHTRIFPSGA